MGVRFGAFEVDLASGELRKHGVRLQVQDQPFRVLVKLLECPGELVSREELIALLWPDGSGPTLIVDDGGDAHPWSFPRRRP